MAWTSSNPVSIGDPTKKSHYDNVFDNTTYLKDARDDDGNSSAVFSGADEYRITINGTDAVIITNGGGVIQAQFGIQPNSNAYSAAEVLDDYEEGSWTVTITPASSGSVTLNTSNNLGYYTKVGRVVHCQASIIIASISSPVGDLQINTPFTIANLSKEGAYGAGAVAVNGINYGADYLTVHFIENVGYFRIAEVADNTGWDFLEGADLAGGGAEQIQFGFSFIAA